MAQRVQVQDLPDAPGLQPTVRSGGQYSVAVQQAGSNKMMDLAASLSKINPILENYAGIARVETAIGQDEALKVADADVMDKIKGKGSSGGSLSQVLGIENRNRAFRNTLIKRAVNNDLLPAMKAESDALLDVEKYKDNASFLQAVDDFTKKKWEDFSGQIGEEAASSDGASVVWNSITGPFKADMLAAYDKKKDAFIEDGQAEEYSLQLNDITQRRVNAEGEALPLDVVGLKEIIKGREELMKQSGITDKAARNSIIIKETGTRVKTLIVEGRLDDADNMLNAMEDTVIGGRRVFNTGEARRVTNQLYADLTSARKTQATRSIASQKQEFTGRWATDLMNLNSFDNGGEVPDQIWTGVRQTLGMLSMGSEEIEEVVSELQESNNPSGDYEQVLRQRSTSFGDNASQIFFGTTSTRRKTFTDLTLRKRVVTSPEEKNALEAGYREWAEKNDGTIEEYKASLGEEGNFETFPELKKAQVESLQGLFVKDVPAYKSVSTDLKGIIKKRVDAIRNVRQKGFMDTLFADYQRDMIDYVQRELRNRGKEKYTTFETQEDRASDISSHQQLLIQQQVDRFQRIYDSSINALKPEGYVSETDGEFKKASPGTSVLQSMVSAKGIDKGFFNDTITYRSLAVIDDPSQQGATIQDVLTDREAMIKEGAKGVGHLSRSLWNYGFPNGFSERNAEILAKTRLDVDDVRLFSSVTELSEKVEEWRAVVKKDFDNEPLNAEERKIQKQYVPYGIFSEDDLDTFKFAQFNLFQNRERL
jgi:hypothetical protein